MPRPKGVPAYQHFKARNLAKVRIEGKDHYLGPYGSSESRAEYDRLIAEHLSARAVGLPPASRESATGSTITEMIAAFRVHAEATYYRNAATACPPERWRTSVTP